MWFVCKQSFSAADIYRAMNPASHDKGITSHQLGKMSSILIMKLLSGLSTLFDFLSPINLSYTLSSLIKIVDFVQILLLSSSWTALYLFVSLKSKPLLPLAYTVYCKLDYSNLTY